MNEVDRIADEKVEATLEARLKEDLDGAEMAHVEMRLRQALDECRVEDRNLQFARLLSQLLLIAASDEVFARTYKAIRSVSMLETETLIGFTAQALTTDGPILEIGSYVGGGTIALGIGARVVGQKLYSVDKGGRHPTHPEVPTSDIGGDWRFNLAAAGLSGSVTLLEDNYGHQAVWQAIRTSLGEQNFGLLVVDADGHVDSAINIAAPFVADHARLIIDDYGWTANEKSVSTSGAVDNLSTRGIVREVAVLGSGTWFGELCSFDDVRQGNALIVRVEDVRPAGAEGMWRFVLPPTRDFTTYADIGGNSTRSHILLMRNGRLHGRLHLSHSEMRVDSVVGFSHWGDHLYFSTVDGLDPRTGDDDWLLVFGSEIFTLVMV